MTTLEYIPTDIVRIGILDHHYMPLPAYSVLEGDCMGNILLINILEVKSMENE